MIEAAKAGADIYVQKPISADVREGAAMVAAARKYDRVVQVGTQRRSTPHLVGGQARLFLDEVSWENRAGRDLLLLPYARHCESARQYPS